MIEVPADRAGVAGLLHRVLGDRAEEFALAELAPGTERFEVGPEPESGRIALAGTSPIAQAAALRAYLRERCHTQITWDHPAPELPAELPREPLARSAAFVHRYHLNVVTYAYTAAWWDWPRWERELDWLAVHGVNRPLIMVGNEAVLVRVFAELGRELGISGLDEASMRGFLGGPAQLPFVYMGCVANWGGPLPRAWVDEHAELGARVVARARELGMTPVLPAFAGHVPEVLAPVARVRPVDWFGFATHALDPADPLFAEIGGRVVAAQRELFDGTDHLYAADPFIEAAPPVEEPAELADLATAVYAGMRGEDPDAVWVFQSWPFTYRDDYWTRERVDAFLGAVPDDRMLILDLWSEHRPITADLDTAKPWVWCMVHNFGGRPGMYGKIDVLASEARTSEAVGLGATMEDYNNDPVLYELLADVAWAEDARTRQPLDVDAWLADWVDARYPQAPAGAHASLSEAWKQLRATVYGSTMPGPPTAAMLRRPRVDGDLEPAASDNTEAPRATSVPPRFRQAWELLLAAAEQVDRADPAGQGLLAGPLGRDLTDVTFVVVSTAGTAAQRMAAAAFHDGDLDGFRAAADRMLASIDDLDRLLATRPEYLLGRWLAQVRRWGRAEEERRYYETNARRLITVWSSPDGPLVDYARRGWSGLLRSYYRPRWQLWVDTLSESLRSGSAIDQEAFGTRIRAFEASWVAGSEEFSTEPLGDTLTVARDLAARWEVSLAATA